MDGSSDVSKAFAGIFSMGSLSHDTATSVATTPAGTELKRKIVTHTIELDFSLRDYGSEVENNDPLFLSSKSDDEVHGWYVKVMSICARAKTLPCDSDSKDVEHSDPKYLPPGGLAKLFREAYFSEIIHEIAPGLSYVARRSPMFDKSAVPAAAVRKSTTVIPGSAANPKITMTPPNSPIMGEEERHRSLTALENDIDDEELDAVDDLNRPNLVIPDQVMYFGENSPSVPPVQFSAFEFCPGIHILFELHTSSIV